MPFLVYPHLYPIDIGGYATGNIFNEYCSYRSFFPYLAIKPKLRPIKQLSQLDELPTDLNLLAIFHGLRPTLLSIDFFESVGKVFLVLSIPFLPVILFSFLPNFSVSQDLFATITILLSLFLFLFLFIFVIIRRVIPRGSNTAEKTSSNAPKASITAKRWHKQGGMRLGMGWMIVDKPEYTYGDTIRFIYHQKAVKPTRLMSGLVRLVLIEATEAGFVTSPTYNHEAIEISRFEIPAGSYKPDEAIRVRGELTLPTYAPSVLIASNNRMTYMLEVKLEVADQPTRELLYHLPIEPAVENGVVRTNEALDQMSQNILRRLL